MFKKIKTASALLIAAALLAACGSTDPAKGLDTIPKTEAVSVSVEG